ncbi:MAG TPA: energy-coupling factor transporter ATPase [Desulfobacteria bacterium]|nr:energy-coupling factor transporter ATPase [Desulfobacteria bacterium]
MIKLENVGFRYGEHDDLVIDGLSLEINPGEILAVIGPNGSGKSTLARLLNGIFTPTSGRVLIDELDTANEATVWEVRRRVGLILQNPDNQLVAPLVEEDVAFGPENLGLPPVEIRQRVQEALAAVGLTDLALRPPDKLSGGQKQRVAIAGVLAMKPKYLVLDEATAMLDPQGRRDVLNLVTAMKNQGVGIVLITHHMNEALLAERVVMLVKGQLCLVGHPREVFAQGQRLREHGLDVPVVPRVCERLRKNGVTVPDGILTGEELVKVLCS